MIPIANTAAVLIALLEVFIDAITPIEANVSVVYGIPLVIAVMTRRRALLWRLTAFLMAATFIVYRAEILPGAFSLHEPFFVNRLLAAVALLVTAALLHMRILVVDRVEAQRRLLKLRKEELEAAYRHIEQQNRELERRRREAEEASGRKTRMLASVSHDIRTPVNTINLMANVIRRTAEDPALATQVPGLAQRLQANASSLATLVSEVLDLTRFESGHVEVHESRFSLNELIREQCAALSPLAEAKQLRLCADVPEEMLWLRSDPVMLGRILSNLIGNAIKFTAAGTVTVSTARTAENLFIGVRDTGVGIPPECRQCIFDEFAQVHKPGALHQKGWGLGLAICRRLAALLGGSITVESELNRGSLFSISLPIACVLEHEAHEPLKREAVPSAAS